MQHHCFGRSNSDVVEKTIRVDQDFGKGHGNRNIMIKETGLIPYELFESKRQTGRGCTSKEGSIDESKVLCRRRQGPATPEAGKGMGQRVVRETKSIQGVISEDNRLGGK